MPEKYFEQIMTAAGDFGFGPEEVDGSDFKTTMFQDSFGAQNYPKTDAPKDIVITIDLSLKEMFNGKMDSV